MPKHDQLLVGLDIGTSKIACVVSEADPDGKLDIIGIGTHPYLFAWRVDARIDTRGFFRQANKYGGAI